VFAKVERKLASRPWTGESLQGRSILLHTEQGFGDALQFLRYVPMVARLGATVILELQRPLARLVPAHAWGCQVVLRGQELPITDYNRSIMSLPHAFATALSNVPNDVPYLEAPRGAVNKWKHRVNPLHFNVGLAWAGQPRHKRDSERSMRLADLSSLLQVHGVTWHSLQVGARATDVQGVPPRTIADWSGELTDFAETAGLLQHLDLVISVDTSVVHLAGAFGRPAWVMVSRRPDWRWLLDVSDSPWYPSMRLYRQERAIDWNPVIESVAADLRKLSVERPKPVAPEYLLDSSR
jgi:hypothetical protein